MADAANPPNVYGQVVGNGQQTVTFAAGLLQIFGGPVSSALRQRNAARTIRDDLGEWASEAFDTKGRPLVPVLKAKAFEDHLVNVNGQLKPTGELTARHAWAHLLYALGIRPGMEVLSWKSQQMRSSLPELEHTYMDIEGVVLCHIINLYGTRPVYQESLAEVYRVSFGAIEITDTMEGKTVHFAAATLDELQNSRAPFGHGREGNYGDYMPLDFEPEVIMTRYFNAVHHGASDSYFLWPNPSCPLKERASALITNLQRFFDPVRPFIISPRWLEEASRVKRRVTTNGGTDRRLINDVVTTLATDLSLAPSDSLHLSWWENGASNLVASKCMFSYESFGYRPVLYGSLGLGRKSAPNKIGFYVLPTVDEIEKCTTKVLKAYALTPVGSWTHSLSEMPDEMPAILRLNHHDQLESRQTRMLEFTPDDDLWTGVYQLS